MVYIMSKLKPQDAVTIWKHGSRIMRGRHNLTKIILAVHIFYQNSDEKKEPLDKSVFAEKHDAPLT